MHVPLVSQSGHDTNDRALDPQKLTAYLAGIEETINKKLVPTGRLVKESGLEQTDSAREILDGLAYAFRGLSLAFNNLGGMPHASVRLTEIAKQYARSTECNDRLDEDYQTLQFLSLQKDAIELAAASRYKESLAKLEAARQFASSDEEKRTIDEWVEVVKKRLALEGVKPIDSTPTMYTFNGIGYKAIWQAKLRSSDSVVCSDALLYISFSSDFSFCVLSRQRCGGQSISVSGKGSSEVDCVHRPGSRRPGYRVLHSSGQYRFDHFESRAKYAQQLQLEQPRLANRRVPIRRRWVSGLTRNELD